MIQDHYDLFDQFFINIHSIIYNQQHNTNSSLYYHHQIYIHFNMSQDESDKTISETQQAFQDLNEARFEQFSEFISTPPTKKYSTKTKSKRKICEKQYDWQTQLTQSIECKEIFTPNILEKISEAIEKTRTAHIIKRNGCKYQNVCPICLNQFQQHRGILQCKHDFCFDCLFQWSKTSTNCPCCRRAFNQISKICKDNTNKEFKQVQKIKVEEKKIDFNEFDYYICYVCDSGDNENVLLICDSCDFYCCHIYCDPFLNNIIPEGDWYCASCRERMRRSQTSKQKSQISENNELQEDSEQETSQQQQSAIKGISTRTRSREAIFQNIRHNNLSTLRNLRRRR